MKLEVPIIGILRGVEPAFFGELLSISIDQGLQAIEVTINTKDAEQMVSRYRGAIPHGSFLGIGTIRNIEEARRAADAGAMFFVTPNMDVDVIEFAGKHDIPVVAGALTPTEVYAARSAGADMIKVFPCSALGGPGYIRELRGPFDQIPLVAVGGVSLETLKDYFSAGAAAVGVSTALFGRQALARKDAVELAKNVRRFIQHCREIKGGVI